MKAQEQGLSVETEWEEAFGEYLRGERQASSRTIANYLTDIRQLGEYLAATDEGLTWNDVDADLVRGWVAGLMDTGTKASTVNTKLCSVRAFYRFLLLTGRCSADRVRLVHGPKKEKPLPSFVREGEMNRLLDMIDHDPNDFESVRDRLMVLMLYMTGIRRGELLGLKLQDVDMAACQMKVTGKRNKQRVVPFGEELQIAMQKYLALRDKVECSDTNALFVSNKGVELTPSYVTGRVKQMLSLVTTAPRKSPHVLRHTFATSMLDGGAHLESVKELLGHESVATTEIYTHTTFEYLRQVYQNSHPRVSHTDGENEKEEV